MSRRLGNALVVLVTLAVLAMPLHAQERAQERPKGSIISGQVRLRSELDDRGVLGDEPLLVHLLRSRIRATVWPVAGITILAEVQDARYWGQSDPALARGTTDPHAEGLDMHQAWAQVDSILGAPIDLRVGRQELSFANERLIGVSNWSNTGRSFDAARATLDIEGFTADLFASRLTAPSAAPTASQNLYGLWGAWKPSATVAIDLFGLRDDNTSELRSGADSGLALLERYTAGTYVRVTVDPLDFELEGAMQSGHGAGSDSTARREIAAFMASATVGFTMLPETKTRIYALGTVLSGDGSPNDDRTEMFNTLFGTNHRLYGHLDIVPELFGTPAGLVDLSAGITSTPARGLRIQLEGHLLRPQRTTSDAYGTELDLNAWWRSSSAFELSGGVGIFLPGPLTETRFIGDDEPRLWGYLSGQFDF